MQAVSGIPDVQPGDSVWWHSDLNHAVAPVVEQKGWGNVIYIPSAPMCEKNARYATDVAERFRRRESLSDFPQEDYEVEWTNRFGEADLNEIGARGLGIKRSARVAQQKEFAATDA